MSHIPVSLFKSPSEEGISAYIRRIQACPMLEEDEEYKLAHQWIATQDPDAAKKLVESHLRLVVKIASGYRGYGLPMEDLIAEGNIGLLQAITRFDPERGARFSTYARWWVQASIQDYVLHSWSMVKIGTSAAQKKLFFNLRKLKSQLGILDDNELSVETIKHIATELDVPENEVLDMSRRMNRGGDASLNVQFGDEDSGAEFQDLLESEDKNSETIYIEKDEKQRKRNLLETCLSTLTAREREIFEARRLCEPPKTLEDVSKTMDLSKERVRQIEEAVFQKLQKRIINEAQKVGFKS